MDDLPEGIVWRPERTSEDRPDLCPAYHPVLEVHCAESADPQSRLHPGLPHRGLGFPPVEV